MWCKMSFLRVHVHIFVLYIEVLQHEKSKFKWDDDHPMRRYDEYHKLKLAKLNMFTTKSVFTSEWSSTMYAKKRTWQG